MGTMIFSQDTTIITDRLATQWLQQWHLILWDTTQGPLHALRHSQSLTAYGATLESQQLVQSSLWLPLIHRVKCPWWCPQRRVALLLWWQWVRDAYASSVNAILMAAHTAKIPSIIINAPERLTGVEGNFTRIHNPRNIWIELIRILSKK